MKKFALLLAILTSFAAFTPISAEARDHRRHHYGHDHRHEVVRRVAYRCRYCGRPVMQTGYFRGYSRHHRPIYAWKTQHHHHRHHHRYWR